MKRFTIYEVQELTDWRVYEYLVKAPSFEAAVAIVRAGDTDPVDAGYCGEPGYGESAFGRDRVEAAEHFAARLAAQEPQEEPATDLTKEHDKPESALGPVTSTRHK